METLKINTNCESNKANWPIQSSSGSYFKNFTDEMRKLKKNVNKGKLSWRVNKKGKSKLQGYGKLKIYIKYSRNNGYHKSLGGGSDPKGCKRGGNKGKKCRFCHPKITKKRKKIKKIDIKNYNQVFRV